VDRLIVTGGRPLSGSVRINGAKNSALKLMAAALLTEGRTVVDDVPRITDCVTMAKVLEHLGAEVRWTEGDPTVELDTSTVSHTDVRYELVSQMRASIAVLGPLLARYGRATVAMPGGCNIGVRKIDLHLKGLERMGASFTVEHGYLEAEAQSLSGAVVSLDYPSVGATENVLMAAVLARGTTVVENAAREPDIQDLAHMLIEMGASVEGAGTTVIEVQGVDELRPVRHRVIPDRIEAGTFAIAACATRGDVVLENARADHMDLALSKLSDAGAIIDIVPNGIRVRMPERPVAADFVTLPYPGFPTDLQPQMMALLATADGTSIATENVFEGRFMFVDELNRMGADIRTEGHHAVIRGVDRLEAAPVRALDIRAGAAMVIAALSAEGTTEIADMYYVDRGYEDLEVRLGSLGAEVHREPSLFASPL
jgi:UDP-N-acetylglucosamine 1-carboxyvinyltransferase